MYKAFLKSDLPWDADLAVLAMAFMLMGIYCRESMWLSFLLDKDYIGIIAFGICLTISTLEFYRFGAVDWYSNSFGNPLAFSVAAICGTLTVVSFSKRVKMTALSKLGENSILFFGLHRIIIDLSFVVYGKIGITIINDSPIAIIWAMISVAIAIITLIPFNWIIIKYFPWALGRAYKKVKVW